MSDPFSNSTLGIGDTFDNGFAVTPNDSTYFSVPCRSLWIGTATAGNTLHVLTTKGAELTFTVTSPQLFRIRAMRVYSSGTTVSNIVALY